MPRIRSKSNEYAISDAHYCIKRHLKADDITQAEFGRALGIGQSSVSIKFTDNALSLGDAITAIRLGNWRDDEIVSLMRGRLCERK